MEIEQGDNVIWTNKDNISTPPLATKATSTAATIVKVTASK